MNQHALAQEGCITFRGGQYNSFMSTSRTSPSLDAYPADAAPYPQMSFVADTLTLNSNTTLSNFPMGIALNNWGEQGYHPQVAIGMGTNSTFLTYLRSSKTIGSRTFGMFWGRQVVNVNTQLDGSIVFGGYDRAKVTGRPLKQPLTTNRSVCPTGMLVTIVDLILNFPNGTNASLFSPSKSTSISACIVPDYPVLMTLPLDPYFQNFRNRRKATIPSRSLGLNFFAMRYADNLGDQPYAGDLTIKLQSGFEARVPNDQLVLPDVYADPQTGQWVVNASDPTIVINAIQDTNANDLMQLGRQFLGAVYLFVNEDTQEFRLWVANPTAKQDLIAVDENGQETDLFCVPGKDSGNENPITAPTLLPLVSGLSPGAISGIVVAIVVSAGGLVGAWWLWRRRKRCADEAGLGKAQVQSVGRAGEHQVGMNAVEPWLEFKPELEADQTRPVTRYELPAH